MGRVGIVFACITRAQWRASNAVFAVGSNPTESGQIMKTASRVVAKLTLSNQRSTCKKHSQQLRLEGIALAVASSSIQTGLNSAIIYKTATVCMMNEIFYLIKLIILNLLKS